MFTFLLGMIVGIAVAAGAVILWKEFKIVKR